MIRATRTKQTSTTLKKKSQIHSTSTALVRVNRPPQVRLFRLTFFFSFSTSYQLEEIDKKKLEILPHS